MIAMQTTDRNGKLVAAVAITEPDHIMLITDKGTLVRLRVADISCVGRNTQGVKLVNLTKEEKLVEIEAISSEIADSETVDLEVANSDSEIIDSETNE